MLKRPAAVLGLFESPRALLSAIELLRARGRWSLEAYTPYPVPGAEAALGLKRSPLAAMVLIMGSLGALTAYLFQWWMNSVDYPIVVGGKPVDAWQAYVPVLFEVTVLFAAFTAGLGMLLLLNRLPDFRHPLLSSKSAAALTRDKFGLALEPAEGPFDAGAAEAALREVGAEAVEVLNQPAPPAPVKPRTLLLLAAGGALACLAAGLGTYWTLKLFPVLPPMSHMLEHPKLVPQKPSAFFKDGRGMQAGVPGTMARGRLPYPCKTEACASRLANPLPRAAEVLRKGRKAFDTSCAVCHGALANGRPLLSEAYGAKPADLQSSRFLSMEDGRIYHTLMTGKSAMPSFASSLTDDERWSLAHYLRALQRAQHAEDEDLR